MQNKNLKWLWTTIFINYFMCETTLNKKILYIIFVKSNFKAFAVNKFNKKANTFISNQYHNCS